MRMGDITGFDDAEVMDRTDENEKKEDRDVKTSPDNIRFDGISGTRNSDYRYFCTRKH